MTRDYSNRNAEKNRWVESTIDRLERLRGTDASVRVEDLIEIVQFHQMSGVELVSFYIYGQPAPEAFTAAYLADRDAGKELVQRLLEYDELVNSISLETLPDPEYYVKAGGPNAPWGGVGQPTPDAIPRQR